jgi:tetratricopeptide (TPR) repeat protein
MSMSSSNSLMLSFARLLTVAALILGSFASLGLRAAHADDDSRAQARARYQAGQKAYASGDYRLAIREFAAAEQLAPSGFNDYNLGLCYDKLGEADPAIRYYRSYLDRVGDAKNRAAVEASIARLEAAVSSAQSKEETRLGNERRAQQERIVEEAKRAEQARLAEESEKAKTPDPAPDGAAPEVPSDLDGAAAKSPADNRTPGPAAPMAAPAPTGNPQLDRVNAIDVSAIRTERAAMLGTGGAAAAPDPAAASGKTGNQPAAKDPASKDQGSRSSASPLYKKWWFWAIIGVSAVVVYNIATEDSSTSRSRSGLQSSALEGAGATLLRW